MHIFTSSYVMKSARHLENISALLQLLRRRLTQAKNSLVNDITCVDVARHAQLVFVCFVCHSERVVLCVSRVPVKVLQLNSQFVVGLTCQSVDLVQPEPELAAQVTEALFVVGPGSVEIDGAVESFLEDSPAPSFIGLVAENVKGLLVVRNNCVDTVGSASEAIIIRAIYRHINYENMNKQNYAR